MAGRTAGEIRDALGDYISKDPELNWALENREVAPRSWRLMEAVNAATAVLIGVILLPLVIVSAFLPGPAADPRGSRQDRPSRRGTGAPAALEAREDRVTQNQFTAVGLRKPGPFPGFTLTFRPRRP